MKTNMESQYINDNAIGIIVAFHGGCFTGGNHTYDSLQNKALQSMGYTVYQPEFPKKYSLFKRWTRRYMIKFKNSKVPIYVLGRSSGGYLAKYVYNQYDFVTKAIYLCPILNPYMRCHILPKFSEKTHAFFDDPPDINIINDIDPLSETLYLAINDKNLPNECLTIEQHKCSITPGLSGHNEMLTTINPAILDTFYLSYSKFRTL